MDPNNVKAPACLASMPGLAEQTAGRAPPITGPHGTPAPLHANETGQFPASPFRPMQRSGRAARIDPALNISLDYSRKQIDALDAELVGLLNRRAEIVVAIGKIKNAGGAPMTGAMKAVLDKILRGQQGPPAGQDAHRDLSRADERLVPAREAAPHRVPRTAGQLLASRGRREVRILRRIRTRHTHPRRLR